MAAPDFNELEVSGVQPLTDDSVAVSFAVPPDLVTQYAFVPGQYLTLRATINGVDVRRSYSISSGVGDALEVGIRKVEQGLFSTMAQSIAAGERLQVMEPQGNFRAELGGCHRYLLIAAGSGITPVLSIAKSVLAAEPDSEITLIYGNRNSSSLMFRDDLNTLKDKFTDRFMVTYLMSREQQHTDVLNGRIDGDKIQSLSDHRLIDVDSYHGIYLCGPLELIGQARSALVGLGADESAIHYELFTSDGSAPVAREGKPPRQSAASSSANRSKVTVILDGVQQDIQVDPKSQTVLGAAQTAGVDLPFSCAGGMCCTCRCKVVEGDTTMDMNFSLADWEVEAGFTLACQTRPVSDGVVLDFDAS